MKAIISGVTGQDGSYLAELLLEKGYDVVGFSRRVSVNSLSRIQHLINHPKFLYLEGDVTDANFITSLILEHQPIELYHLAAQSHVGTSFKQPDSTFQINTQGTLNILNAIKSFSKHTKMYNAATSELWGSNYRIDNNGKKIQDLTVEFRPNSPYAVAKLAAYHSVRLYRESYGLFCCSGVLHNHEGPRRGEKFVTRKIAKWIGDFSRWLDGCEFGSRGIHLPGDEDFVTVYGKPLNKKEFPKLRLGNIDSYRDFGYSQDYVEAMFRMLQSSEPKDYVVSTGEAKSVKEFLQEAFRCIGIEDYENYYVIDPEFFRPCEVPYLCGNAAEIEKDLGWKPKVKFKELVKMMVENDIKN